MLFSGVLTIPANTAETAKASATIKISDGVIHQIGILFPDGCNGLVKAQLFEAGHQFSPSTEGLFYTGNDTFIIGPEFYEPFTNTNSITVKGWSTNTRYNHDITVYLWILPKSLLLPTAATEGLLGALRSLVIRR